VEMSPQRVRSAEFKTVRKGADLDEVRTFLNDVADELERAQNQSAAMEARARAAVARLQEVNEGAAAGPKVDASAEEAETISRTLLLAQRTADSTVAEARTEAAKVLADAKDEAARTIDSTREMSAQLLEEARVEARKQGVAERQSIASEVEALKARRDFLEADVHQLETFLVDQRSRVREAASALLDVADRVPGGLGEVRAPLLSASDDAGDVNDDADAAVGAGAPELLIVGANEFVFYDGPPFANGLPHYGHLLTGYVKDASPATRRCAVGASSDASAGTATACPPRSRPRRSWASPGTRDHGVRHRQVQRRLPDQRAAYTDDWRDYVTRQARWVDFDNDYKTLDLDYMESVMWAFKTLWDKGLVYEGFRVLAYCWRCETPLSNTETRMDDVYRDRQDPALTVGFELETGERMLAWTTTPWTLPSNLALAVHPDIDYAVVELDGEFRYVLADALLGPTPPSWASDRASHPDRGSELVGRRYTPLFDYFADAARHGTSEAFRVLAADFVSTEDGTGIVHLAPASARTTRSSPTPPASRRSARWTNTAATPPRSPTGPASTSSTPTRW
jgi:cell division septum initiation protein DivIVA